MKINFGLSLLVMSLLSMPAMAQDYEEPAMLSTAEVLRMPLNGKTYSLNPVGRNDGRFNFFKASFHRQPAETVITNDWVAERIYEADAIVVLRQIKETDAYEKGLDAALQAPLTLTRDTLTDPVKTLESIPDGLSNILQDLGAAIGSTGKGGQKEDNALVKDLIGFNKVKRKLASELGVDVYSSNALLQQELDDVAWAMFAGGAVIDVALMAAPLVASLAVDISEQANTGNLSWGVPPATMQQAMAQVVKRAGLNDAETEALVFHKACSLNHISSMVTNMTALGNVQGVGNFYRSANQIRSERPCRDYRKLAQLAYLYHVNKAPLASISMNNHVIAARDVTGRKIIMVVADYLSYSEVNEPLFSAGTNLIWTSGFVSGLAQQVFYSERIVVETEVLKRYQAPLDIIEVLLPERAEQMAEQENETNRTGEVVDDVTEGVGNVVNGVLGTLTAPLSGGNEGPQDSTSTSE